MNPRLSPRKVIKAVVADTRAKAVEAAAEVFAAYMDQKERAFFTFYWPGAPDLATDKHRQNPMWDAVMRLKTVSHSDADWKAAMAEASDLAGLRFLGPWPYSEAETAGNEYWWGLGWKWKQP